MSAKKQFTAEEARKRKVEYETKRRAKLAKKKLCIQCGKPVAYRATVFFSKEEGMVFLKRTRALRYCFKHTRRRKGIPAPD